MKPEEMHIENTIPDDVNGTGNLRTRLGVIGELGRAFYEALGRHLPAGVLRDGAQGSVIAAVRIARESIVEEFNENNEGEIPTGELPSLMMIAGEIIEDPVADVSEDDDDTADIVEADVPVHGSLAEFPDFDATGLERRVYIRAAEHGWAAQYVDSEGAAVAFETVTGQVFKAASE